MTGKYNDYVKVLFITPIAFNRINGGGITFANLFKGWPSHMIAAMHDDDEILSTEICNKYYKISTREISRWPNFLNGVGSVSKISSLGNIKNKNIMKKIFINALYKIKEFIFGNGLPERVTLSYEMKLWLEDYKPDVIYTILGKNSMMELALKIRESYSLPMVIHIMDDWVDVIYSYGLFSHFQRRKKNKLFHQCINAAEKCLSISDAMSEEYWRRYKIPFEPVMNVIDRKINNNLRKTNKPIKIIYSGSIIVNCQLQSLLEVARVISVLKISGSNISFSIYAPEKDIAAYKYLFNNLIGINFFFPLENDVDYFQELESADVLVLPVNFDCDSVRLIKYSMPTKVPAYLSSGVPILAYGPIDTAQIKSAVEGGWAYVVQEQCSKLLAERLLDLLKNQSLRKSILTNAESYFYKNHNAEEVRGSFRNAILSAHLSRAIDV
jgi:glycosyltransferase involved in cell wall biosynthesis